MRTILSLAALAGLLLTSSAWTRTGMPSQSASRGDLDTQVRQFLDSRRSYWRDMNVTETDGRAMYDIIVGHKYKSALEIGTSTGHSGIWIAWALSKSGGRLITVDLDRYRHEQAVANFKAAGLAPYIDARLGDAHEIVPALQGPFDFVFSDADKDWYINYAKAVLPKISVGGCLVTHNVSEGGWGRNGEYLRYLRSVPYLETTLIGRGGGMSVSYKKEPKQD